MRLSWVVRLTALALVVVGFVVSLHTRVGDCGDALPCEHNRWDAFIGSVFGALVILYLARMFRRD